MLPPLSQDRVFRYVFVRVLAVDAILGAVGTIGWLAPLGIQDPLRIALLCVVVWTLRLLIWAVPVARVLAPARHWMVQGSECGDDELLDADRALARAPMTLSVALGFSEMIYFLSIAMLGRYVLSSVLPFGQVEFGAMGFLFGGLMLGPPLVMFPIASLVLHEEQAAIGAEICRRSLENFRAPARMAPRVIGLTLAFVTAASLWFGAALWNQNGQDARSLAQERARAEALGVALQLANGAGAESVGVEGAEVVLGDGLPPELASEGPSDRGETRTAVDIQSERVMAAVAISDNRWVVVEAAVEFDRNSLWLTTISTVIGNVFGVLLALVGMLRLVTVPLSRLRGGLESFTERGNLREIGRLPADRKDEIGMLTVEFNRMLSVFEALADASSAVARGELSVEIVGTGDIHEAFRSMVNRLAELVSQIHHAAVEVASASTEIHAATQGQEMAANQQFVGMRDVSVAIQRLTKAAADISNDAGAVLVNAEQTRVRSDEVVGKIAELGRHIDRIGELLDLIRDVADRSDLLALNGSLEATRAGEAGRGFALVSTELRRLAERVTAAVADVHATINDVGNSTQATIAATEASRVLASNTTEAARRIVEVIASQSSETEEVSTKVTELTNVVEVSVAATSQTRAAADGLRQRAAQLERLIERFEVSAGPQ